jgi:hypothetical protein
MRLRAAALLALASALVVFVACGEDDPSPPAATPDGGDQQPVLDGATGTEDAADTRTFCKRNFPTAPVCDDFDDRELGAFARAGWTRALVSDGGSMALVAETPPSAPSALRVRIGSTPEPVAENAMYERLAAADGGLFHGRVAVEAKVRIKKRDPAQEALLVNFGFVNGTDSGVVQRFFSLVLQDVRVLGRVSSGPIWDLGTVLFDGQFHKLKMSVDKAPGGAATATIEIDGKLAPALNDAGTQAAAVLDGFQRVQVGIQGNTGTTGAREIDFDDVVVSY